MQGKEKISLPAVVKAPAWVRVWRRRALLIAAAGACATSVLAWNEGSTAHLLRGWLLGVVLLFGFAVGGLALLMLQYCAAGRWSLLLRRPLEAMSRTLPLVFLGWLVLAAETKKIYLWARIPDVRAALLAGQISAHQAHCLEFKHVLLNPATFAVTGFTCFGLWMFFAWRLNRLAQKADEDLRENAAHWQRKLARMSAAGLVFVVLTVTLSAIEWILSLDVTWASSIFGLLLLAGLAVQALAWAVFVVQALAGRDPYKSLLQGEPQRDMGRMLFALVLLQAYLAFSQFLIVWSGNLPEDASWYLARMNGGWGMVMAFDWMLGWLVPFVLLLARSRKEKRGRLKLACAAVLLARCVDLFWMIEPGFGDAEQTLHFSWALLEYATVPLAMSALWAAYFLRQLEMRPLLPVNDPLWKEAEHE